MRRSRDRSKTGGQDTQYSLAVQRHVLLTLSQLLAPLMPFLAESMYKSIDGEKESVHLTAWPIAGSVDVALLKDMVRVREVASRGLELRERAGIKVRQPLAKLSVKSLSPDLDLRALIAEEVNVKEVVEDAALAEDVVLDTAPTPELKEEGVLRDTVRSIQEWRKTQGYTIGDRPIFKVADLSPEQASIVEKYRDEIIKVSGLQDLV